MLTQVNGTELTGDEVEIEVREVQTGGVMHETIPGDMLVSIHDEPQVGSTIVKKCGHAQKHAILP